jgi:hypothetical protein
MELLDIHLLEMHSIILFLVGTIAMVLEVEVVVLMAELLDTTVKTHSVVKVKVLVTS